MSQDRVIQLSIDTLRSIANTAEKVNSQTPGTLPIVRIFKTCDRVDGQIEDKYEVSILLEEIPAVISNNNQDVDITGESGSNP